MGIKLNRGGSGRGQGRKKRSGDDTLTECLVIRVTKAHKAKLTELGGAEWVRKKIEGTPLPALEPQFKPKWTMPVKIPCAALDRSKLPPDSPF